MALTFVVVLEVRREVQSDDHEQNGYDDDGRADGDHHAGRFTPFLLDFGQLEPGLHVLLALAVSLAVAAVPRGVVGGLLGLGVLVGVARFGARRSALVSLRPEGRKG
ncbi:hypothetical protein AVEN_52098-1 [Araneus ventricosus]|uniref:Uncharacterized protein n=1 Tax=Araneus ventricosus TaxID=182803 RepID=A0A4Y2SVA4_ARAVE|nr:hypothetical protein AVEN_52098-1 [Araneus ventricosus]